MSVLFVISIGKEEVPESDERHGFSPMFIESRTDPLRRSVPVVRYFIRKKSRTGKRGVPSFQTSISMWDRRHQVQGVPNTDKIKILAAGHLHPVPLVPIWSEKDKRSYTRCLLSKFGLRSINGDAHGDSTFGKLSPLCILKNSRNRVNKRKR